jgi:hypothetical protein
MSARLIEELRALNLQPGQRLQVEVDGRSVELFVRDAKGPAQFAEQVMLDPWVTLPDPPGGFMVRTTPGRLDLPQFEIDETDWTASDFPTD